MATIAISMNIEEDVIIFNNLQLSCYYNEFYYGKKVLSDLYIYQGEVEVEKLTHFPIKLPELNPDN